MRRTTVAAVLSLTTVVAARPAFADQTVVEPSHSAVVVVPVTAQQVAPPACDGLALTSIVIADTNSNGNGKGDGSGRGGGGSTGVTTVRGTDGNDLLLGSAGRDRLDGGSGSDCLVGGAGDDHLDGGAQQDACLPGSDPGDATANCEILG